MMKKFDIDMVKIDRNGKALALAQIATQYMEQMLEDISCDDMQKEFYKGRLEWCKSLQEEIEEATKQINGYYEVEVYTDILRGS